MKKTVFYLFLLLIVLFIAACGSSRSVPVAAEVPVYTEEALFPTPEPTPALLALSTVEASLAAPTPEPLPTALPSAVPLNAAGLPVHDAVLEVTTLPIDFTDQAPIKTPGDVRTTIFYFGKDMNGVQFQRIVCDDNCNSVTIVYPDGTVKDLRPYFEWISFPAGGTGDVVIDAVLVARGLNLAAGETLSQNTKAIWLGNVPAGTYIVVVAQDDPNLMINVGVAYIRFVTTSDAFTIDVATIPAN